LAQAKFPKGTTGSQLDILARSHLWNAGLDYDHGTGHGVGAHLSVHEGPQRISKMPSKVALQPGMIISNEPGYYKTDAYGIRIENLVCVCNLDKNSDFEHPMLGFETLTFAPIDMRLIDLEILTKNEVSWLNTYHAQVLEKIGPQLENLDLTWLKNSTKLLKL
jgi:Xaa-Pro aminopeptidase